MSISFAPRLLGCIATFEKLLLKLGLGDLDLDSLVDLLRVSPLMIRIVFDGCGKERVYKCRLPQSRLTSDLSSIRIAIARGRSFHTIIVKAAPLFATILCLASVNHAGLGLVWMVLVAYRWLGSYKQLATHLSCVA